MDNLPFTFVEKQLTAKNTKLDPITDETIKKYLLLVTERVEKRVANDLPENFGIVIDGWKEGTTHYIAVFASYFCSKNGPRYPLLALAPPLNEQSYTAEVHRDFIGDVLELFGKSIENLLYLVADNAPVNTRLSDLLGIPFIGCASHRFNLACKKYLLTYEQELSKINSLMVTLRNVKQAGKLRTKTRLCAVPRNDTRWSSTYAMLKRFFEIQEFIDVNDLALAINIPSAVEVRDLKLAMKDLEEFETVTKLLQEKQRTVAEVRCIFDGILQNYDGMDHYIGKFSDFVHSPDFENGIVKIILDDIDDLSEDEKIAVEPFRITSSSSTDVSPEKSTSVALLALKKMKKRKVSLGYASLDHIPPTSNIVERLFSSARLVLTDYRKSMDPYTFECLMFLKVNRSDWDINLVSNVIGK